VGRMEPDPRTHSMECMISTKTSLEAAPSGPVRPRAEPLPDRRAALHAFAWTAVFIAWHGYWALGGDFGFGDQESGFPDTTSSAAGWIFSITVVGMFVAGLAVPLALARGVGRHRLLVGLMWAGAAVLGARGLAGLVDDALRFTGLVETGLSGLSDEQVLDTAHPSAYTIWSTVGIDAFFAAGALLFGRAALHARATDGTARARVSRWVGRVARLRFPALDGRSQAWAAYAASAWAIAYAVGVRGYQGLGGTLGLPGRFEDPAAVRQASLLAGAGILLVGVGALALVRPWGLRLPRWLVIVPGLAGSVYAAAHALIAYVTKPLDLLGVIQLDFPGWAELDKGALIRWDLLFYEPWFLGLGVLVTLGTLHHYRRTGGSDRGARRLLGATVAATLALTAVGCGLIVAR
jgi:hypothetical protein